MRLVDRPSKWHCEYRKCRWVEGQDRGVVLVDHRAAWERKVLVEGPEPSEQR